MSISIIAIDNGNREIFAVSDKRVMLQSSTSDGKVVSSKILSDDMVKIKQITNGIYIGGGRVHEDAEKFEKALFIGVSQLRNPLPSEVIAIASSIDKKLKRQYGVFSYHTAMIFGVYDNGEPFYWEVDNNGYEQLSFVAPNTYEVMLWGGLDDTQYKVGDFVKSKMETFTPFEMILPDAILFASTIDGVISPAFDYIKHKF